MTDLTELANSLASQGRFAEAKAIAQRAANKAFIGEVHAMEASKRTPAQLMDATAADAAQAYSQAPNLPRAFGRGAARGAAGLVDLPFAIRNGLDSLFLNEQGQAVADNSILGGQPATEAARAVVPGFDDRGDTPGEKIAGLAGEFSPGVMALGGASALPQYAFAPAVASHYAGEAAEGETLPDWLPGIGGHNARPYAEVTASLAAPFAATGAANVARRAVTPNPADPARIASANRLKAEGIPVSAGQATGAPRQLIAEDTAPGLMHLFDTQTKKFTEAIMKRLGVKATDAGPKAMKAAETAIGNKFDDVVANTALRPTNKLLDSVRDAHRSYLSQLEVGGSGAPLASNLVDEVTAALKSGNPIPGAKYHEWRKSLGPITRRQSSPLQDFARDAIKALDDAMEASVSPARMADWKTARQQWRDYLAVVDAMKIGDYADAGLISPARFRSALSRQGDKAYVTGSREGSEFGRDAALIMGRLPHTKQQSWQLAHQMFNAMTPAVGGGGLLYGLTGSPQVAAIGGAAAQTLMPAAKRAFVGSRIGQKYLANQAMTQPVGLSGGGQLGLLGSLLATP